MKRIKTIEDLLNACTLSKEFARTVERETNTDLNYAMPTGGIGIRDALQHGIDNGYYERYVIDENNVYEIEECYSEHADKTFILAYDIEKGLGIAVKGWYWGEPNDDATDIYYGK